MISIGSENVVSSVLVATGDIVRPPGLLCRGIEFEGTAVVVAMEVIGRDSRRVRRRVMLELLAVIEEGEM